MADLKVKLTDELAGFVDDEVKAGTYVSASEVVRDGLRLLKRERDAEREKLAILRREIDAGLTDAREGRFSERSVSEIAQAVMKG